MLRQQFYNIVCKLLIFYKSSSTKIVIQLNSNIIDLCSAYVLNRFFKLPKKEYILSGINSLCIESVPLGLVYWVMSISEKWLCVNCFAVMKTLSKGKKESGIFS